MFTFPTIRIIKILILISCPLIQTYKSLSTPSKDIVCNGVANASQYLIFSPGTDPESVLTALCATETVIDDGLKRDSVIAKAVSRKHNADDSDDVNTYCDLFY